MNKYNLFAFVFSLMLSSFPAHHAFAQISQGGKPVDERLFPSGDIVFESLPAFEMPLQAKAESATESAFRFKPLHYAHTFSVSFSPENNGIWRDLPDGSRVWKMGIESAEAFSLNLIFDRFEPARGVRVFLYNPEKTYILGAFDQINAPEGILAVSPVPGEQLIVEMIVPSQMTHYGDIRIGKVNHDFHGILPVRQSHAGESEKCNIDINCPEGNTHQLEKNSIVRLLITTTDGSFVCTGALVNNTGLDGKPYVLTANHCLDKQSEASTTVFLFGYEASSCNGSVSTGNTLSGSTLRATRGNIDLTLLELNQMPPLEYRPYYMGWNRQDAPASATSCIHHPSGDIKKIATDIEPPVSTTVTGFMSQGHWRVNRWDQGTTEGGSSGAPLIDENFRIVGFLTGGFAECGDPVNDYFAKVAKAWDTGSSDSENLKPWLDPANSNPTTLDGMNPYRDGTLEADFEISTTFVCKDEYHVFTDFSRGSVNSWSWNFGGDASPGSATGKGPHLVTYSSGGQKTVTLLVEDGMGADHLTSREINLTLKTTELPVADFSTFINLRQVSFTNLSQNGLTYYWDFGDGLGENSTSTLSNPGTRTYGSNGDYEVSLLVRNGPCESLKKETLLKVLTEELLPESQDIKVFPNPAQGFFSILLPQDGKTRTFELINTSGTTVLSGSILSGPFQVDASHLPAGLYLIRITDPLNVFTTRLILHH
jgi:lysyl endopeptidase